jgi:hypothetical protein
MKRSSLNKRLLQAGLACLSVTAGAGLASASLLYDFTSSNGNENNWSAAGYDTSYSFITDSTIPAGLGTQALLFGALGNNSGSPSGVSSQATWNTGSEFGDINAGTYNEYIVWIRPSPTSDSFQFMNYILNGGAYVTSADTSGTVSSAPAPDTATSLGNGWYKLTLTDTGITGGNSEATDWTGIYQVIFDCGMYNNFGQDAQCEIAGLEFTNTPEPSPWVLFTVGIGAFGLATLYRRKLLRLS